MLNCVDRDGHYIVQPNLHNRNNFCATPSKVHPNLCIGEGLSFVMSALRHAVRDAFAPRLLAT